MKFIKSNGKPRTSHSKTQLLTETADMQPPFFHPKANNGKPESPQNDLLGDKSVAAENQSKNSNLIQMQKEQLLLKPCIEKTSEIFLYNNYDLEDSIGVPTHLLRLKKEILQGRGEIKTINIVDYCDIGGEPGTKYFLDPKSEKVKGIINNYKQLLLNAGISHENAVFNVSARYGKTAGENDGGCPITVQFKYILCG